jgi:hypothetical protein
MKPCKARLTALSILCVAPAVAWSQVYTWIDENGTTVYSNVRPEDADRVKDFKRVVEAEKPAPAAVAAPRAAPAAPDDALRREQALQHRIENLEQRLRALQYQGEAAPSGFGLPYYDFFPAVPVAVIVPSHLGVPRRSLMISSRHVVNSGPVFVAPTVPSSMFLPGIFTSGVAAPKLHIAPKAGHRAFGARAPRS